MAAERRGDAGGEERQATMPARDVAAYCADLTAELADLARGAGHATLAYLLDVARLEAAQLARQRARPLTGAEAPRG